MPDGTTKPTAFRLDDEDRERIKGLIDIGAAKDATDAVRLALRLAPVGLVAALRGRVRELAVDAHRLAKQLEKVDPTALVDEKQLSGAMLQRIGEETLRTAKRRR